MRTKRETQSLLYPIPRHQILKTQAYKGNCTIEMKISLKFHLH
jgi:hypothetical protein